MSGRAALLAVVAVIAAAGPARAHAAPAPPTITMSGQPITQALVADLAWFYRHAVADPPRFALTGGGTGAGVADVARGITDGGLVSRALTADDPAGLVLTPIARSAVCLVTPVGNPVRSLSRAQVQDLVAGRLTRWSQVPGAARTDAIAPVALTATAGGAQVFDAVFVDAATPVAWRPATVLTNAQMRDAVAATPAALGYVDLALTGPLNVVAYDGVPCTRRTVRDGSYPARVPLGVVTRGRPRGPLARFLRWVRTSPTARRVIATRYLPA